MRRRVTAGEGSHGRPRQEAPGVGNDSFEHAVRAVLLGVDAALQLAVAAIHRDLLATRSVETGSPILLVAEQDGTRERNLTQAGGVEQEREQLGLERASI